MEGAIKKEWKFPAFKWLSKKCPKMVLLDGAASLPEADGDLRALARRQNCAAQLEHYQYTTSHETLQGDVGNILPKMVKLVDDDIPPQDKSLSEASLNFYKAGIDLFGNGILKYLITLGPFGFNDLDDYNDIFNLPNLIPAKSDTRITSKPGDAWKEDHEFGRQRLQGLHPTVLEVCKSIPEGFNVTDDDVKGALNGKSLADAMAAGNIFICDYHDLAGFAGEHVVDGEKRYVYAPFALFYASYPEITLIPIAVQLRREPTALIWTPNDGVEDWIAAKMYVANADFAMHQFKAHAMWCHLSQEPIAVSLSRNFSEAHPVWKLLRPHFHGLLGINAAARGTLVAIEPAEKPLSHKIPGIKELALFPTVFGNILSMGAYGNAKLCVKIYETYDMQSAWFKNDLEARGLLADSACDSLGSYPYRDDGLLLFESINIYVTSLINLYYKSDDDISKDPELQGWVANAQDTAKDGAAVKGFPTIANVDSLIELCTNLIFTASVYHAAVNFSQVDYAASILNIPGSLFQPAPTEKGKVDKAFLVSMMPNKFRSLVQLTLVAFLSKPSNDHLGSVYDEWFTDPDALAIQAAWKEDLVRVEHLIEERNTDTEKRPTSYTYMLPSKIPNSTAI